MFFLFHFVMFTHPLCYHLVLGQLCSFLAPMLLLGIIRPFKSNLFLRKQTCSLSSPEVAYQSARGRAIALHSTRSASYTQWNNQRMYAGCFSLVMLTVMPKVEVAIPFFVTLFTMLKKSNYAERIASMMDVSLPLVFLGLEVSMIF